MPTPISFLKCLVLFPALFSFITLSSKALPESKTPPTEFANPPEVRSIHGVLRTTFVLQPTEITLNGRKIKTNTYNGLYAPPTLRVHPGDTVELDFDNRCPQPSNIHFHGLSVSPLKNGDNIFIRVDPGHTFQYRFQIPKDHNSGLYYYHAHAHGMTERQITFGFTGAFIVEGQIETYPALAKIKQQVMVLKDMQVSPLGNVAQTIVTSRTNIRTVNGLVNPTLHIQPGETQQWRIANTSADLYYRLTLEGQTFWVMAEDGNTTTRMIPVKEYLLGPSARVEAFVQLPQPGVFTFKTEKVRTGPVGDGYPAAPLVQVVCAGSPQKPLDLPFKKANCCATSIPDLSKLKIDQKRLIVFNETNNDFRVNNQIFDENRIDTRVPLGHVEEWTIRNATDELHQFHIHQVDFQVVEINGKPVEFTGHRDNYVIPIRGEVKIIIPFTNPIIVGTFVYHCHIIGHEDGGMMASIQVYDPRKSAIAPPPKHLTTPPENPLAKGGPIELISEKGTPWRGHTSTADLLLVTFGYTRCQGACPRTLVLLDETLRLLKTTPGRVQPLLISVDPERDTPKTLLAYENPFQLHLVKLTGTTQDIARVAQSFGVAVKKQPNPDDGSYTVKHSTDLFLTTRDGQILSRFPLTSSAEEIVAATKTALEKLAAPSPVTTATR